MWEQCDPVVLLIAQKLFRTSTKIANETDIHKVTETSVRKVMSICTIKKIETLYAQKMTIISYLHYKIVHFVGSLLHFVSNKNQSV